MENTKLVYFNLWKKGKKRYENVEGLDQKWSNYEYDAFLYPGPRAELTCPLSRPEPWMTTTLIWIPTAPRQNEG